MTMYDVVRCQLSVDYIADKTAAEERIRMYARFKVYAHISVDLVINCDHYSSLRLRSWRVTVVVINAIVAVYGVSMLYKQISQNEGNSQAKLSYRDGATLRNAVKKLN